MGFDNECILSIQSLPGEYFCPVCRTLIYPNEALQSQCTHLYCKPCLAYIVATTKACPYDGYLVTEIDSKPLMESNKSLAETIGKVVVHCLYHKSGCQWQGTLSACITHGTTCAYGNSPVVCNRCGTQIVHRQVQEHAQLCPGLQPQTQQTDGSQAQPSVLTTQSVAQDPSLVASAGSAAAADTTLPSATTTTAVTASSAATGGPAGAITASTAAVPPSVAASSAAPQTPTAEQWYQQQQLQYSQYYQQQYPGYNPYMQQYQQYDEYQQVYQQYTQPQMQVASQNTAQGSAQPASYVQPQVQPSQAQYVIASQPRNQPQFQPPAVHPQPPQHPVQPQHQSQPHLPHLQAPAGQLQPPPIQSAPQVPQLQLQSRLPLQLPGSQAQPTAHPPAPTQVGNQQLAIPSIQSTPLQLQPHVQAQHPQQQHVQLQTLPPQQNLQPQMQLKSQVQQQSYPQPQAYAQPTPHAQPQNTSYPQQHMPQGAPLQHPEHVSHQQGLAPQHPAPMHPTMPGQQPAMLPPQAVQYTPQYQQHIGYHAHRLPMHSIIPFQTPQQGLPPHSFASSQAGQSYQQGMPSSQQQVHSQPSHPHGPPYTQQHIPGHGYAGHHVQTSAGKPMSHVAPPQQFQHQAGGPANDLLASVMNQQPPMPRTSDNVGLTSQLHGAGQPTGQSSLTLENHAPKSGKSEIVKNAADDTTVSENKNGGAESAVMRPTMSQSLGNENMNIEQNDFGSVRKDVVQTSVALDSTDGSIAKDEIAVWTGNSNGPGVQGGKEHKASNAQNGLEKGGSLQQVSWQNAGALGSYVPPGMVPQHPSGQDRMLPQHMIHSGPMPSNMQKQPNQMRPPKHSFSENTQPPRQQPYSSFHSETTPRAFGDNQIQMPMPQPVGIRPGDGMIRPPIAGPLPGRHDAMMPPFVPEQMGRPPPLGMSKSNDVGGGPLGIGRAFHEERVNASGEHLRSLAAYPGRHDLNHKDIEDGLKQFPGLAHLDGQGLQRGPRPFERALGRPDVFPDSLPGRPPFPNQQGSFPVGFHEDFSMKPNASGAEFGDYRADGMPNIRNPGPFVQGMSGALGGLRTDQLGSGNLPGNVQRAFDGPEFPHTRFHPGHMHPDDHNLVADYSRHGFPKETSHFGLGGLLRNGDVGWCRICMFNCGSAENLNLHVQAREHQQYAMDIVLKMKQDVAKRQKLNFGGPKSFHNKKVAGKGHFR
ncbi:chromatin modification-related protein eaf-1-like [Phragmites australis]|uniref:chromatin modification-related protein eaf-1-like n=1 Tax=Phragmites australis TaxID=29695 RepID=UPI002D76D7F0|nr:chromatin modification-related protein eaf-1-like [Phragmites australis]XP_062226228.1 chromatin modification-related protein eaf-1-like [Phragmites australis]XP_062226251.1 chromatin modification-related protein eaf-1-like [Phragmites australis]